MDDTTIKLIEQSLGVKVHGGSFIATWFVLNWLGSKVKISAIPNEFIPAILVAVGGVVYVSTSWLLSNPFDKSQILVGLATGFVAVGSHQALVRTKQAFTGEPPKEAAKDPPVTTP